MSDNKSLLSCPHCGWKYDPAEFTQPGDDGRPYVLVPGHILSVPRLMDCPGTEQHPRNPEADRRPLWKDGGVQEPIR